MASLTKEGGGGGGGGEVGRKEDIIIHFVLLLAVFRSTAQRMDHNLVKQGMGTSCHFVPWNSRFSGLKISVTVQPPSANRGVWTSAANSQQRNANRRPRPQEAEHHSSHTRIGGLQQHQ